MSEALYDIAGVRSIERRAGGDDVRLMELAGQAGWRAVLEAWPQARRIVVACGPGNNGGDGYVLARHAHEAGRDVQVVAHADHAPRTQLARDAQARLVSAGGRITMFAGTLPPCDVVVDAVLGIGLSRAPDAGTQSVLDAIHAVRVPVLALDVPSGVDAGSGAAHAGAVQATRTVEFIARKAGLRTGAARGHVGVLQLATLELHDDAFAGITPTAEALHAGDLAQWLQPRRVDSHKGMHGHVACIGGDVGHGGAIVLCAQAALRAGAGLVSIRTHAAHVAPALARLPESMVAAGDVPDAELLRSSSVCAIGPGLGQGAWGHAWWDAACRDARALVVDADALNLLAATPVSLPAGTVLTPHPGEAARLLRVDTATVQADRFGAARALVERFQAVVVLKGAGTLVAAPGQRTQLIDAGNAGMAVGGMGDVLAGVIAALRAQGLDAFDAARAGALLHAAAGDIAARDGERGLMPSDLFAPLRRLANPGTVP